MSKGVLFDTSLSTGGGYENSMNIHNKDFTERFEYVCSTYADKAAITYLRDDGTKDEFAFSEIYQHAQRAKEQFLRMGLHPGDRAAIISPHNPFAVIAALTLSCMNIAIVLIDAALPQEEINRLLTFSDVRAVFTFPETYDKTNKLLFDGIPVFDLSQQCGEYQTFPDAAPRVLHPKTTDPDLEVISILFSSGTTASTKGVMVTYTAVNQSRPMYYSLKGSSKTISDDSNNLLFVLPLFHVAGFFCAFQHFMSGCGLGMIENVDALKISKAFHSYNPEFFALVPKFYEIVEQKIRQTIKEKGLVAERVMHALLSLSRFSRKHLGINIGKVLFSGVRSRVFGKNLICLGTGGSKCNEATASFFLDLGIEIWANFYSLTETYVPTIATCAFDRYPASTEGNVKRFNGIDVKVHDSDENGIGEIRIKTILVMKGYFRDPELTASAFDKDGYFKTGDLGWIDKKGYLHITGRIKEAIHMHTGKKVAPSDVDNLYGGVHPNVTLASCGVPAKDGYDEIHLFIEKGSFSAEELQEIRKSMMVFSNTTGTMYQISGIHFIDKLPLTSVGKVKRFQLKEIALAESVEKI